jgi:hypothetical protein
MASSTVTIKKQIVYVNCEASAICRSYEQRSELA